MATRNAYIFFLTIMVSSQYPYQCQHPFSAQELPHRLHLCWYNVRSAPSATGSCRYPLLRAYGNGRFRYKGFCRQLLFSLIVLCTLESSGSSARSCTALVETRDKIRKSRRPLEYCWVAFLHWLRVEHGLEHCIPFLSLST